MQVGVKRWTELLAELDGDDVELVNELLKFLLVGRRTDEDIETVVNMVAAIRLDQQRKMRIHVPATES